MPPFTHIEDKFKKHPNFLIFIQRRIKKWLKMLHNSPKICYNKQSIHYKSIDVFIPNITKKSDNGSSNEMRESIIGAIVNKQIPEIFFKNSVRWSTLKKKIFEYIEDLSSENGGELLENYVNIYP
jgi:transcriptional regulator NrdR family protein